MHVEFQEYEDGSFFEKENGIKSPKVFKLGDHFYLRCYNCGLILGLSEHAEAGMVHVNNGVVDIRGSGSHSIGDHGCGAHYKIYDGEVVPA